MILPDITARVFHLGPLTDGDIPLEIFEHLSKKGNVALDVQGYLRKIEAGKVVDHEWEWMDQGLGYVDILKMDAREARILMGTEDLDLEATAAQLSAYGIAEILINLGSLGSLIYSDGKCHTIPAYPPRKTVDPTGCGDTYMAGYIYQRLKLTGVAEAGSFAAAVAALKLEQSGPFRGTESDVRDLMALRSDL